jgi:hypothetical protein
VIAAGAGHNQADMLAVPGKLCSTCPRYPAMVADAQVEKQR